MTNYTQEYNKTHYKQLKRLNISKAQFVRDAIKDLINKR